MDAVKQDFSKVEEQLKYNMAKLGTVYNYKPHIPKPSDLGASDDIWIWDFIGDIEIIGTYVNYLLKGPALGNRYQLQAGWCKDGSNRTMIVDNVPSGAVHIPGIPAYTLGATNLRGLVPGLLDDIWQIEPQNLLQYMKGKGQIFEECFENKRVKKNYFDITICLIIIISYLVFIRI